jgi:hypothetical protein
MNFYDFNPNFKSKHLESSAVGAVDFPMEKMIRKLDGEPEPDESEISELAQTLREVLFWITATNPKNKWPIKSIGIKAIAAAWVISPEVFGGVSANILSQSFKTSSSKFSRRTSEFSRRFGIKNRFQSHYNGREQCLIP